MAEPSGTLPCLSGATPMRKGTTVDATVAQGLRVLAAIAAGADASDAIAERLELPRDAVATHVGALVDGGFVRRDGERLVLADRTVGLLDGLLGRTDLLAIAAPIVLEAERRLGVRIDVDVPEVADPVAIRGPSPFALVTDDDGGRALVACALDTAGQVACVLRTPVDGAAPEEIEVLGKELVVAADAISVRLPQTKDRGPDWFLRY